MKAVDLDSGLKSIALNIKIQNSVNLTTWDAINCEMIKQVTTKFLEMREREREREFL